ncbi:squamous cell carcinoma antigen recognized by T-cells 3-like [Lineus longissimus]|uniref:squamous cell carcinoma antigen recognized by T-cells 3-like n=1 Tax=Lineus longissimus TaxID=88925 RepID=UPI002B4DDDEA
MADVSKTNEFDKEDMEVNSESEESSSSSDDADDGDDEIHNEIVNLEAEVKHSPFIYNKHIELIKLCSKHGEFEKLRDARERMHETFPLDETLWQEWIQDEIKFLDVNSQEDRAKVENLFERCVQDYMSVPLWLEYVQFSIGGMAAEGGIEKVRHVFEKAITAVGIHASKGSNIWEAYREFENAVLAGLQPELGGIPSKAQQEEVDTQINRITAIFKRQLQIPLFDMEQTYEEYKEWAEEEDKHLEEVYKRKKEKLKALVPYENELLKGGSKPSYEGYLSYIDYELSEKEPARIQNIFERAIKDHCLQPDLWVRYLKYLDEHIKIKSIIMPLYERAVRNCPWSVEIWSRYIRVMERHHEPHKVIVALFDKALNSAGFTQGSDFLQIWMAYLDYLRRRVDWQGDHDESLQLLRKTFPLAIDHVLSLDGGLADPTASLQRFWASIEARHCKDMVKAREIWHEIMAQGHATQSQTWIEFLNLERAHGDAQHCRKILGRAINSVTDWPETMCEVYINYEREEGTLEDYDMAVSKVEARLKHINERRAKEAEKEALAMLSKRPDKKAGKKGQPQSKAGGKQQGTGPNGDMKNAPMGLKRKREDNGTGMGENFKVPSAPSGNSDAFKPPAPVKAKGAPPPGFKGPPPPGYQPKMETDEPPQKKAKEEAEPESGGYQHDAAKDLVTVFVSNILFRIHEDMLKEVFSPCGDIAEVRLVKSVKGMSKGYAYVEFTSQAAASKALTLDRQPVEGRPMYVSPCSEKRSKDFRFSTDLEKNKLFVKNLPYTCTREALETIFGQHGKVKHVRMVTYKNGAPKGLAYVEFETEQEASAAVMKTDGLLVGEHEISVAISQPPPRRAPQGQKVETSYTPTLGGGKRETAGRGKSHTVVSLLPRALQKKQEPAKPRMRTEPAEQKMEQDPVEPKDERQTPATKMSNADFRNLLLKK